MIKKIILAVLAIIVIVLVVIVIMLYPGFKSFLASSTYDLDTRLRVFLGSGGNSVVLHSDDGKQVAIVDTKMWNGAKKLRSYVDSVARSGQITIFNTHLHRDHSGGNTLFPNAHVVAGAYEPEQWLQESGMKRMPDEQIALGEERLYPIADDTLAVRNLGQAHSWNDMVVYFRNRKLLMTGDLVFNGWHPALLRKNGGHVGHWIKALDFLIDHYDPHTVVPGHGPVGDKTVLLAMRDYYVSIRSAINDKAQLKIVEQRYQHYRNLPGNMSSFAETVAFMKSEQ